MSENNAELLGNEWSTRHIRLRNQSFIFALVFCIFCFFTVDIKLPFVAFRANSSLPSDWIVKAILLFVAVWTIISLIIQTLREERKVSAEEEMLNRALKGLNDLSSSLNVKLDEFLKIPPLNKGPDFDAIQKITDLVSKEVERVASAYEQQAEEISVLKPWNDSIDRLEEIVLNGLLKEHPEGNKMYFIDNLNSLKEMFEARKTDLLRRTYNPSEMQSHIGSIAENKDYWHQISNSYEAFRESFPRFVQEMNDKSDVLKEVIKKHRNAIGSSKKTVNFFDKTFAPWVPVGVSTFLVIFGIMGWLGPARNLPIYQAKQPAITESYDEELVENVDKGAPSKPVDIEARN